MGNHGSYSDRRTDGYDCGKNPAGSLRPGSSARPRDESPRNSSLVPGTVNRNIARKKEVVPREGVLGEIGSLAKVVDVALVLRKEPLAIRATRVLHLGEDAAYRLPAPGREVAPRPELLPSGVGKGLRFERAVEPTHRRRHPWRRL